VTPFGELIAVAERGTLMGNRGCLHDRERRIRRPYSSRRWIICVLSFRGRRRQVMAPRHYTELFFLDEATALAAGHRPCAECQRERYILFRRVWAAANRDLVRKKAPSAEEIDRALHGDRLEPDGSKRTFMAGVAGLPPGVMVADPAGTPWLVLPGRLAQWTPGGYVRGIPIPARGELTVLTPRSVVRALALGYPAGMHPTAEAC
jgi:hypothetical protein